MFTKVVLSAVVVWCGVCLVTQGMPALTFPDGSPFDPDTKIIDISKKEQNDSSENGTDKDLYVIRAVVYEIGILTEVDDDANETLTQERVDLTFFDAHSNDSHIDLGHIPLPVQTNISGQVLTGIAPVSVGAVEHNNVGSLLQTLPLTGSIVNIQQSDTGLVQLTRSNDTDSQSHIISANGEPTSGALTPNAITTDADEKKKSAGVILK